MDQADVINYTTQTLNLVLWLSLPPVLAAATIGILISLIQALTQVQEQTLPFAFKLVAVIIALAVMMETIGAEFYLFTQHIFGSLHTLH